MKERISRHRQPESPEARQRLQALRSALFTLHKTLVESERVEYEKVIGKIQSRNHFLQLLTSDPWFAWLSPLSQLIISTDETLEDRQPLTNAAVETSVKQSARLLVATETGSGFSRHYHEALQRDPDVVLAHAEVAKLRRPRKG